MPIDTAVERLKRRRTKIVATVGPASSSPEVLRALLGAGVDVFRLNMSHGTHDDHAAAYEAVRAAAREAGEPVAVLADLAGPKIRTGVFEDGGVDLREGGTVTVTTRPVEGRPGLVPSAWDGLADDVAPGHRILLDDGNLELRVEAVEATEVRCTVVHGGRLSDRKGMNLPDADVSIPSLTSKDRDDAGFALGLGVDLLALSFVRRASDMAELRDIVSEAGTRTGIIAKIEKPRALEQIDRILAVSDGIMVARGDLGVELPPEVVPIAQDQLVELARASAKPVIVATQMLESMVSRARPTRAEVSDVSNAVRSGADAIMLSAETAVGSHPVLAVQIMDRIARETEGHLWRVGGFGSMQREGDPRRAGVATSGMRLEDAISRATGQLSRDLRVQAIVVFTRSGWSAAMVAASRPLAPVLAVSDDAHTLSRARLLWGVVPVRASLDDESTLHELARRLARESGLVEPGGYVLRVWGFHSDGARNAPSMSVLTV